MKRKYYTAALLIFSLCILWGIKDQTAQAAKKSTTTKTSVTSTLKNGVLTFSGKGTISSDIALKDKNKVKKVVIKKGITSIGDKAFRNFKNLKEVSIPTTVKKIGCYSFAGTALKNVTVPTSVKTIGQCAFYEIKGLENLTMPGKFSLKTEKGDNARYFLAVHAGTVTFNTALDLETAGMMSAKNFVVSEKDPNYKSIQGVIYSKDGKSIVRMPLGRGELVIEDGCEEFCLQSVLYCDKVLSGCPVNVSYVRRIVIPASVKTIESQKYKTYEETFEPDINLALDIRTKELTGESIEALMGKFHLKPAELMKLLPENINANNELYITKDGVLLGYTGKETKVFIPDGVRKIAEYAFANCNLTEIQIPDSVTSFGKGCFYANNFSEVHLPDNIQEIPDEMFDFCRKLKKIEIPDSVKRIGAMAFCNDKALEEIVLGKNVQEVARTAFWNIPSKKITIHGSSKGIENEAFSRSCSLTYTKAATEMKTMFVSGYQFLTKGKQPKIKVTLSWSKVMEADGYQIIIAKDKKFKKNKKALTAAKNKKRIQVTYDLKDKKQNSLYARIRPYKTQNGKKIYGRWTTYKNNLKTP